MDNNSVARFDVASAVACTVFIVIGTAAIYVANDFSILGSVFPQVIAGLMIILSCLYLLLAWRRPKPRLTHEPGSGLRRFGVMITMLAWAFLLDPLGFLSSGVLAFAALLLIANFDRWTARTVMLYAAAGVFILGSLFTIFKFALQVPLPQGWLF
ncbi:tripartite tricarboxylate transporter TctB family protein [Allopusillimonas ginsengisoli]|uniref:tripartite tricarboxylate transporter TctB family protein n=1 Tax=Allopusillimonas ginsengisoli TaxID=453575 RepID=UPI0039C0332A